MPHESRCRVDRGKTFHYLDWRRLLTTENLKPSLPLDILIPNVDKICMTKYSSFPPPPPHHFCLCRGEQTKAQTKTVLEIITQDPIYPLRLSFCSRSVCSHLLCLLPVSSHNVLFFILFLYLPQTVHTVTVWSIRKGASALWFENLLNFTQK